MTHPDNAQTEAVLLLCPFCGGAAYINYSDRGELYGVRCNHWRGPGGSNKCMGAGAYANTAEEAIAAWNTRVTAPATPAATDEEFEKAIATIPSNDVEYTTQDMRHMFDRGVAYTRAQQPAMSGWRTMESAPQDWSTVIVYIPAFEDEGGWHEEDVLTAYYSMEDGGCDAWLAIGSNKPVNPTHWMPLPTAPKEGGGNG